MSDRNVDCVIGLCEVQASADLISRGRLWSRRRDEGALDDLRLGLYVSVTNAAGAEKESAYVRSMGSHMSGSRLKRSVQTLSNTLARRRPQNRALCAALWSTLETGQVLVILVARAAGSDTRRRRSHSSTPKQPPATQASTSSVSTKMKSRVV